MVLSVIETLNANLQGDFVRITRCMIALENNLTFVVLPMMNKYRNCLKSVSFKFQTINEVFLPRFKMYSKESPKTCNMFLGDLNE